MSVLDEINKRWDFTKEATTPCGQDLRLAVVEIERLSMALTVISEMGTGFGNATVRRICKAARAAIEP